MKLWKIVEILTGSVAGHIGERVLILYEHFTIVTTDYVKLFTSSDSS
jgi:hypothetical protein